MARAKAPPISPERLAQSGSEDGEQMAVFCWAAQQRERWPVLRWLYHVPNGGSRHKAEAGKLKAMGVKKGVADIHLDVCVGRYNGLIIELKRADGTVNDVDELQLEWLAHWTSQGRFAVVAFGWRQATAIIDEYLSGSV